MSSSVESNPLEGSAATRPQDLERMPLALVGVCGRRVQGGRKKCCRLPSLAFVFPGLQTGRRRVSRTQQGAQRDPRRGPHRGPRRTPSDATSPLFFQVFRQAGGACCALGRGAQRDPPRGSRKGGLPPPPRKGPRRAPWDAPGTVA